MTKKLFLRLENDKTEPDNFELKENLAVRG